MSMIKTMGIYYTKSDEIYYKSLEPDSLEVNYGDVSGSSKSIFITNGVICFLTDTGELFSYYVNVNTRANTIHSDKLGILIGQILLNRGVVIGVWGGYTVNVSAPIKITWDSSVDRALPYNYVLKKNGKIHELQTRSQNYLNAPSKMQIALTKNPITDAENLIHCEKNTHGGSIYVYVQPIRAEDSPVLLQELVLPESADDVGKIVTNGNFIVASLINHGVDTDEGSGAVIVYKKRNNGLFSYLQTIESSIENLVQISVPENLDFGIDIELTDDNLIITNERTLSSMDAHSYIAIYEYGEFYWELVQEIFNDEKLNEKSYVSNTLTSVYGGEHSLVADSNNLFFKSYVLYEGVSTGSYAFLHASKIIGTFVIDFDNPIRHPQEGDASIKHKLKIIHTFLFGDPKLYGDYLMIPSVEFIDSVAYVPSVLIYKRNDQGKFLYTSTLSYAIRA